MSIRRLILAVQDLKKETSDTKPLDEFGDRAKEVAKEAEEEFSGSMLRMRASADTTVAEVAETMETARENVEQTAVTMEERIGRIFDDAFTHNGLPLEEYLTGQRDKIKEIEGTLFGGYLDQYAKIFEFIERQGAGIDPRRQQDLERSMEMLEGIIRKFAGPAGADFSFEQLRREIRDMVREQREALKRGPQTEPRTQGRTSGTLGNPTTGCGSQPSTPFSVMIWQGGIR